MTADSIVSYYLFMSDAMTRAGTRKETGMNISTDAAIKSLADGIMRAVVAAGVVHKGNIDGAITVMRAELMSFLTGDEYAAERDCVINRTLHQNVALASVVASCVIKIKNLPAA